MCQKRERWNITVVEWGKLRHIRGRDAREKRESTCATGRPARRMATTQFAGALRDASLSLPPPSDAESTCINATGGRLLRAYPNVSRAGFVSPFRLAGSSRPQLRNVPSAKCRRRIRFFDGAGRERGRGASPHRASIKSRNE